MTPQQGARGCRSRCCHLHRAGLRWGQPGCSWRCACPVPPAPSRPHRSFLSSFCFGGAGVPQAVSLSCCIAAFLLGTGLKSEPGANTLR